MKGIRTKALIAFSLALLFVGETLVATTPGPFPYSAHFKDSDSVLVVECVERKELRESDENESGITLHNSKIKFLTRATFKGPEYDDFFEMLYNEPKITNGKKLKAKMGEDTDIFILYLDLLPDFEQLKTYLIFIKDGKIQSGVEIPKRP